MTWVKLDDAFTEHPRVAALSNDAFALWIAGLAYSNRNLTDGFVPFMVGLGQLRFCEGNAVPATRELETARFWRKVKGGWHIRNYEKYQPSRAEVEAEREWRKRAGQKGGRASAQARTQANGQASAQGHAQAFSKPVPVPIPSSKEYARAKRGKAEEPGQHPPRSAGRCDSCGLLIGVNDSGEEIGHDESCPKVRDPFDVLEVAFE